MFGVRYDCDCLCNEHGKALMKAWFAKTRTRTFCVEI